MEVPGSKSPVLRLPPSDTALHHTGSLMRVRELFVYPPVGTVAPIGTEASPNGSGKGIDGEISWGDASECVTEAPDSTSVITINPPPAIRGCLISPIGNRDPFRYLYTRSLRSVRSEMSDIQIPATYQPIQPRHQRTKPIANCSIQAVVAMGRHPDSVNLSRRARQ